MPWRFFVKATRDQCFDASRDFIKATRDQCFNTLDCLRDSSGIGGFVEGVETRVVPLNGGGELGQNPEGLFKLRL